MVVSDGIADVSGVSSALAACGAWVTSRRAPVALRLLRDVTPAALVVVQSEETDDREALIRTIRSWFPGRADMIPTILVQASRDDAARAGALSAGFWECLGGAADLGELPRIIALLAGRPEG
jgi:hypothetical protein